MLSSLCQLDAFRLHNFLFLFLLLYISIVLTQYNLVLKAYYSMYLCPLLACRPISWCSPSRADNPLWTERTHGLTRLEIRVMPSLSSSRALTSTTKSSFPLNHHIFSRVVTVIFSCTPCTGCHQTLQRLISLVFILSKNILGLPW